MPLSPEGSEVPLRSQDELDMPSEMGTGAGVSRAETKKELSSQLLRAIGVSTAQSY